MKSANSMKAQSAMEYLTTYGWALLIITLVFVLFTQLGIFNSFLTSPRAQPGSCQVFRPNGPGTTSSVALSGLCNSETPKFSALFNGQNANISTGAPYNNANPTTVIAWVKPSSKITTQCGAAVVTAYWCFGVLNSMVWFSSDNGGGSNGAGNVALNSWSQIAAVITNPGSATPTVVLYLNGTRTTSFNLALALTTPETYNIGSVGGSQGWFPGYLSNVQAYNSSLSANEIKSLYLEGMGGAPIDLEYLIGWWPLNGDAIDYSGNLRNGVANSIIFKQN